MNVWIRVNLQFGLVKLTWMMTLGCKAAAVPLSGLSGWAGTRPHSLKLSRWTGVGLEPTPCSSSWLSRSASTSGPDPKQEHARHTHPHFLTVLLFLWRHSLPPPSLGFFRFYKHSCAFRPLLLLPCNNSERRIRLHFLATLTFWRKCDPYIKKMYFAFKTRSKSCT